MSESGSNSSDMEDTRQVDNNSDEAASKKEEYESIRKKILERIGKRLAYLLRYGACKEGLNVTEGGYVKLSELLNTSLLNWHTTKTNALLQKYNPEENVKALIMEEIKNSTSHRNVNRFEVKQQANSIETYVRATYGRKFERSPYHMGCKVNRLLEICLNYIVKNINSYDFEDFPDEFLINELLHRLKRAKKLNAKIVESLLNNNLEHLDFDGIFLTEKIFKIVCKKCKNLKILSLKDCGYFLNDHYFEILLKNCPLIESLDLSFCKDLTDRSLNNICKYLQGIVRLVICGNSKYSEQAVIELVRNCTTLRRLDVYDNASITEDGMNMIVAIALSRPEQESLEIIHKTHNNHCLAPDVPWFNK